MKKNPKKNEKSGGEIWRFQRYFVSLHRQKGRRKPTPSPSPGRGDGKGGIRKLKIDNWLRARPINIGDLRLTSDGLT